MGANNTFNPDDYSGNVQSAVAAAKAAGGSVVLSAGKTYSVSAPVVIDWYGGGIECATPGAKAKLRRTTAGGNVIEMIGGTGVNEHNFVKGLQITRTVAPSAGACGIAQVDRAGGNNYLSKAHIHDCEVYGHAVGLYLGGTDYSTIGDLIVRNNTSHGVEIYGRAITALQWYWEGQTLIQHNGGSGLYIHTNAALNYPSGLPGGNIRDVHTYANGGFGFLFEGSASCPLMGVRVAACFLGDDGRDEIHLNTYGNGHVISNCYTELGHERGIYVTANNDEYRIENCAAISHKLMGIASCGNDATIVGNVATGNGLNGGSTPWGLYLEGLRALVTGNKLGNRVGPGVGFTQTYGIVSGGGSTGRISENNLFGNNLGPTALSGAQSVGFNIT